MSRAAQQLEAFSRAGGQVLFGTDVGYIQQFDTSEEIHVDVSRRNEFPGDSWHLTRYPATAELWKSARPSNRKPSPASTTVAATKLMLSGQSVAVAFSRKPVVDGCPQVEPH